MWGASIATEFRNDCGAGHLAKGTELDACFTDSKAETKVRSWAAACCTEQGMRSLVAVVDGRATHSLQWTTAKTRCCGLNSWKQSSAWPSCSSQPTSTTHPWFTCWPPPRAPHPVSRDFSHTLTSPGGTEQIPDLGTCAICACPPGQALAGGVAAWTWGCSAHRLGVQPLPHRPLIHSGGGPAAEVAQERAAQPVRNVRVTWLRPRAPASRVCVCGTTPQVLREVCRAHRYPVLRVLP